MLMAALPVVANPPLPLIRGNSKLGESIWQFSLPAVDTCPGMTAACHKYCYARRSNYKHAVVCNRLATNNDIRHLPDFVSRVVMQIKLFNIRVVRVHAAGDFDSEVYVGKWQQIAKQCPGTKFYAYTRSWRVENLLPALTKLSARKNFQLWFSCDHLSGKPPKRKRVRIAYMAINDKDSPAYRADIVFRVRRKRKQVVLGGVLVCPVERKEVKYSKLTCEQCRLCIDRIPWLDQMNAKLCAGKQQEVSD